MGILSQRLTSKVEGHTIEIEAVDTGFANKFSLIIDNKRVDEQGTFIGGLTLRGVLEDTGPPVIAKVLSGILVTRGPFPIATHYSLLHEDRECPLT